MISKNNDKISEETRLRVVFAWNYLEWGGAQVYFLGIASRIKEKADVKFLLPRKSDRQFVKFCEGLDMPFDFFDFQGDWEPAPTLRRKLQRHWNKVQSEIRMLRHLRRENLDGGILHVELAPWQSLIALVWLCRRTNVFVTMHNALPNVPQWRLLLWKLKFALITRRRNFHIFASNQDAKNSLKPFVSREFFERVRVTYTNVNPDEIEMARTAEIGRRKTLRKFGLPEDRLLVFCLGQFIDRKGRWTFLEAARMLKAESRKIAFVWVSNSNLTEEESERIRSFGLDGSFFLVRSESVGDEHLDVLKFLRLADVFALPSFVEGLPISLLEAMALGIPSISTDVYAIPEAVKDLETGLLIKAGDSEALAGAIRRLAENERLRKTIAENGRAFVLERFNEKKVAEIVFESYLRAVLKT